MKISAVMCTFRRLRCMERSIACFFDQDWPGDKELVIFSTDSAYPIVLGDSFTEAERAQVRVVVCDEDYLTGAPYANTGAVRRDALTHATGTHFISFDDDDLYFGYDFRQRVDGLARHPNAKAWKPRESWMLNGNCAPYAFFNWLEASVLADIDFVRAHGFRDASGPEHLAWMQVAHDRALLIADEAAIPGYAMVWADPPEIGGHKQSAYGANPMPADNFARHKAGCTDVVNRPLERRRFPLDYRSIVARFGDQLRTVQYAQPSLYEKYVAPTAQALAGIGVTPE